MSNSSFAISVVCLVVASVLTCGGFGRGAGAPIGEAGSYAVYRYDPGGPVPASNVERLVVALGEVTQIGGREYQWYRLEAFKANGEEFRVWVLTDGFPPERLKEAQKATARYILQEGDLEPLEYVNMFTGEAVLPVLGFWRYQIPRAEGEEGAGVVFPKRVKYLGLPMEMEESGTGEPFSIPKVTRLELPCDLEIGNKCYVIRDKRVQRRFDNSEYEYVTYERSDYQERFEAGETTVTIPESHEDLVVRRNVFYQGVDGKSVKYPEALYRSNYHGGSIDILDEPAAITSFATLRPELEKNPELKKTITAQYAFETFRRVFHEANYEERPTHFIKSLMEREDVDTGDMYVLQANFWTWEVPICSGAYQLRAEADGPPSAIVYEGRLCTSRDLPVMDSIAQVQIPTNDQKALLDMHYGMLRGAARTTAKKWGMSIYGQYALGEIHQALKYAYDCGSSYFIFWTSDHGHHIPYLERLAYSRFIRDYAEAHPDRDMEALRRAAEVIILFPPGYTLLLGEPMWWLPSLNLERKNQYGLKYRDIIHRIGMEIERCYRLGICYDLAWDLEGLDLSGYREVIRVKENGTIEVTRGNGSVEVFNEPRPVERPAGEPPQLTVTLSASEGTAPLLVTATAEIEDGSAPIYFTPRHDETGVWRNEKVMWQLYGPEEWDYRNLSQSVQPTFPSVTFHLEKPGAYRLRASVVDRAGRCAVVWKEIGIRLPPQ